MSTYTVRSGETFASIARKVYGSERHAGLLSGANPGAVEPLTTGIKLVVPPRPGAPADRQSAAAASSQNEVALLIDGVRFRGWSGLRLRRSLDTMDALEFFAPFDSSSAEVRDTFRPFSFKPLVLTVGGSALFTGTLVGVVPVVDATRKAVKVSGYSVPGVLEDCTAPASRYPVEFNKQALPAIARALAEPFGLAVSFTAPPGAAFERVALNPHQSVLSFLSDLARQRGFILSSTTDGALLFQRSAAASRPVASLRQGASPVVSVTSQFHPQRYYSHVTGLAPELVGAAGSQYTVKNPHVSGAVRPLVFTSPDVQGGDIETAVAAKAARMFGNMASYKIQVDTWRDSAGALWAPNTTVSLEAPDAMVYGPYDFLVRSVDFHRDSGGETAALDVVMPGAFSGEIPGRLPWEG